MQKTFSRGFLAAALAGMLAMPAWSAGLMDTLKSQAASQLGGEQSQSSGTSALGALGGSASSLGLPSLSSGTASNAAGVLQYCVKNNYLSASGAQGVKDKLLGKLGLGGQTAQKQDSGYQQGLSGLLQGSDGSSFSLSNVKGKLKEKACDYVLDNAKSFL